MLNGELREILRGLQPEHGNSRVILDFGGDHRGFGRVSYVTNMKPPNTIIEAGYDAATVNRLLAALVLDDALGEVELFVVSGEDFAYYQVGSVLVHDDMIWLTAGEFISGGG
jgi:hypothetical protein